MAALESAIFFGGVALFMVLRRALMQPPKPRDVPPRRRMPARSYEMISAAPGNVPVRLVGRVKAVDEPLSAAISGRPCVGYLVRGRVESSRDAPLPITDLRDPQSVPFLLDVRGEQILVDRGAAIACPTDPIAPVSTDRMRAFLAAHELEHFWESAELEEGLIVEGDTIAVTGTIEHKELREQGYRDAPQKSRMVATSDQPLLIVKIKK